MTTDADGTSSSLNCIGICNSNVVKSQRLPPVIPLKEMQLPRIQVKGCPRTLTTQRTELIDQPIRTNIYGVKKMRTRRDKVLNSSEQNDTDVVVDLLDDSDDEENNYRSRVTKFILGIVGILIIILGIGVLIYAIIIGILSITSPRTTQHVPDDVLSNKILQSKRL